jgi:two-component system sensor histidine kinase KdpD
MSTREAAFMREAADLCRDLGGKLVEIQGESPSDEVVRYIAQCNAAFVVLGQSARTRFQEIVYGSIINKIMRRTNNVDIVVVADSDEECGLG